MGVLVGRRAPDFTVPAVSGDGTIVEEFNFGDAVKGRYAVVLFYALDFSTVCPTELIAVDHRLDEFKKRHVEVIGVSIDSHYTHNAWRNTPVEHGGIGPVGFTLAADMAHRVCRAYGVENLDGSFALRASFLIDTEGVVRHQLVNDIPLGRSIDELLRMVDALQFHEEHGELCPEGWRDGDKGLKKIPAGAAEYLPQVGKKR